MSCCGFFARHARRALPAAVLGLLSTVAAAQAVLEPSAPVAQTAPPRDAQWASVIDPPSNLHRVGPDFYRSARLSRRELPLLAKLGIKTVINLRKFHADGDVLKGSGIKLVRVPVNTWAISDVQVVATLKAIRAAEREGAVLLHCLHGADRTGLMTAMYRMVFQGWSRERAIDELHRGGYGYHTLWKNIDHYLRQVDPQAIGRRVEQDGAS
ncbi:MAG: dual specificity protein phosphatase family protein [Pseudomonadota bacterium]